MVIIKVNARLKATQAQAVVEGIHAQAGNGVIVLPNFCELLNEVPEDEEIKVIQQSKADQVAELEEKLAQAMAYISAQKDCDTCLYDGQKILCQVDCLTCAEPCECKSCHDGSNWKWRHDHENL